MPESKIAVNTYVEKRDFVERYLMQKLFHATLFTSFSAVLLASSISGILFAPSAHAETLSTGRGKVTVTQGHVVPACRMVLHTANGSQIKRWFRIPDGKNDINAILLTALSADKDVEINYDPAQTTGCGSEPAITYVSIY